jgi:hypothetical protein
MKRFIRKAGNIVFLGAMFTLVLLMSPVIAWVDQDEDRRSIWDERT